MFAGGSECTAYDVIVNVKFLEMVQVQLSCFNVQNSDDQHNNIILHTEKAKVEDIFSDYCSGGSRRQVQCAVLEGSVPTSIQYYNN